MNLYYSFTLDFDFICVDSWEALNYGRQFRADLKYQPGNVGSNLGPLSGSEQCVVGSLTGAVSSQRVTEEHEGALIMVGNHEVSEGTSALDCIDKTNRYENLRIRWFCMEGPSLNG